MDFDKEMEKKFDDLFWYVLNEQTQQLNKEKEYMELNRTCQEITGTNSKIQSIIENNESVSLTKEEVELLVKYFTSCIDRMLIEQKKMFYLGGKYFYYLMKEMELVKGPKRAILVKTIFALFYFIERKVTLWKKKLEKNYILN